ncbi:MAG: chemotaxis protein CheW [Stigonema ocellatum SAG 48.90 = DSM 106950]|nr:chemotaxis protein CheW [Stigonema ocellatum SAG 48.90 = DSM 106950]
MAGRQFCTFFVNKIYFGIDVLQVQEVIRFQEITYVPLAPLDICGLINLRGQIVTVIDLQRRLEMRHSGISPASVVNSEGESLGYNVIVHTDSEIVGLLVDDIGDVLECREENFEPPPATLKGKIRESLQAAYKLEEGFLLILNIEKILE